MLNHILAALNDYAFAFNQDEGNYTYISGNIADLAGYEPAEFKDNTCLWFSLIDNRDIKKVENMYDKPLESDKSTSITYRITTAEGKTKWINDKRCLYTEENGEHILLSIVKDLEREDEERYNKEEAISGYGILFDTNPNPMWIYEVSSLRFLKVNAAAIKTYGYTEAEFLTMTIQDIRPMADQNSLNDFLHDRGITEAKFIGYSNSGIWRHLTKNGEMIHAEMYGDTIQYKHYDCRLTVATNITERLYYQEEAKIREQFLNSLIDSQTNFLVRINMSGEYTFINKRFMKILGYNKADIIGRHFRTTALPEEIYLCEEAFYNCTNNPGKIIHLSHKKPDVNGNLHDIEWEFIAVTNDSKEVTGIQGVGQDITDKINSQKEISWTKKSLEAIINNTEDLIWSIDRDFGYLYLNQAYKNTIRAQTGVEPQPGDSSMHVVFGDEVLTKWKEYYARGFMGEAYIVEDEFLDSNTGNSFFFETSFNPIFDAEGKITGMGCFSRNITERINTSKSIIDQNERLRNIASLSSHELRRPVATMLGLINIIDRENFNNPENIEIINHLLIVGNEIDDVIRLIVNKTFIGKE
ncbi:PAS domain S-box protein [Mucilaginibacter sp. E4BP6]|uniref:PAS domain S-box protein n=1 Tax=Mucilaginibacter sp. E4BP6 TaxID=2723089 RepID=UPI0015CBFC90|nr:PAS domain S-box protein [Mucilaginibacter sp. E4BP6]NYE64691.1 PAS domain S-box-containing protein [Mucilaginibacter sp. E4BP6]